MANGKAEALGELQEPLLGGGIDAEAPGEPAAVEVRGITYTVPGPTKKDPPRQVLKNVSCAFPPGKLSAVMGASGSGKTSLLTLMRGLSSPGAVLEGQALCNGRRVDPEKMRSISSVVPQQDVFLSALTPRETLDFAAQLRLPAKLTAADRKRRVDRMLAALKLGACADTPIGDEAQGTRGISGGERRRLSVGVSIIGDELPQLLLCDEPTSGLDSAAAASMVGILSGLAGRGVTVVCAIHQPSFAVFKEFHSLLLLEAGQTVYFGGVCNNTPNGGGGAGGPAAVEAYFASHGSPTPEHVNPAHHYITEIQAQGDAWAARWAAQAAKQGPSAAGLGQPRGGGRAGRSRSSLSVWQQTRILTRRTLRENFKNKKKFFRGVMSRLPASTLIGFFFWRMATPPTQHSVFPLKGVMFVAIQNPLIETFYAGAATFQLTKGLLKREYYDGLYQVVPFYLSYYIGFLAMQIPWTFAWVTPLYLLVGLPLELRRFSIFLLASFLVILMACAAGSAVGTRTKDADGNRAVLMPLMIPMVLFSGYVIPYEQIPSVWKPLYYLSPVQWGVTLLETNQYTGLEFVDCDASLPASQRHCYATGDELLASTSTELAQSLGIAGMLLICFAYIGLFMALNIRAIRANVLDGRV